MSEALQLAAMLEWTDPAAAAELRRLDAENERLNQCLQYEQHRAERVGTHGPGCHAWGPQHYECAVRLNGELVEALRVAVKLNGFREFNDHIPAMKAALAKAEGKQ